MLEHLRRERLAVAAVAAVPIFKQRGECLGDRGRPCVVKSKGPRVEGRTGWRSAVVGGRAPCTGRPNAASYTDRAGVRLARRGACSGPAARVFSVACLGFGHCRGSPSISRKEVVSPPERREPTMGTLSSH